jgi:hypothetical protein
MLMCSQAQEEGLAAFVSVAYIFMFIKVANQSSWNSSLTPAIMLDDLDLDDPSMWLNLGYPPSLYGVGDLSAPNAAFSLLDMFGTC